VLFPHDGITKGEIIQYYLRIADLMIPQMHNRPLALQRFVHDIAQEGFYQKEVGSYFPDWIATHTIRKKTDGVVHYILCNDAPTLVYLANQLTLVFHIWPTRIDKLNYPDRMIFDLDPSGTATFSDVRFAASQCKQLLDELQLTSYVMTTGSRGVHIVVPIERIHTFNAVRSCAHAMAQYLVNQNPDRLTLEMHKAKRGNKIFLDVMRNTYGHHSVAPYSVRAIQGAPVATPISWDELLKKGIMPQSYTVKNIFRRLSRVQDPWADIYTHPQSLKSVVKQLNTKE
jgi:bifunctional non-homologous end joining protein LigD